MFLSIVKRHCKRYNKLHSNTAFLKGYFIRRETVVVVVLRRRSDQSEIDIITKLSEITSSIFQFLVS